MLRALIAVSVLLAAGGGVAQVCQAELEQSVADYDASGPATSVAAAVVLQAAVRLAEPALPRFDYPAELPLAPDEPGYEAVSYLAGRRLLPPSWQPGPLDTPTWQEMLRRFMAWYRLDPYIAPRPTTVAALVGDASEVLERVSAALRPAAMIASDPADRDRLAFLAIIWNWTIYPRLLVLRPPVDATLANGFRSLLAELGNCALRIDRYVFAPEPTARQLFVANNNSRMIIAGSEPDREAAWPRLVPSGEELDYFMFQAAPVADLEVYAAVFDGPQVGIGRILSILPRLRTNLGPRGIMRHLETP